MAGQYKYSRILIADSDKDTQQLLMSELRDTAREIERVSDYQEFIHCLLSNNYDICILNSNLSDIEHENLENVLDLANFKGWLIITDFDKDRFPERHNLSEQTLLIQPGVEASSIADKICQLTTQETPEPLQEADKSSAYLLPKEWQANDLPGLRPANALTRLDYNADLYRGLLEEFHNQHAELVAEFQDWIRSSDPREKYTFFHTIKSFAALIGAEELAATAARLENSEQEDPDSDLLCEFHRNLKTTINTIEETTSAHGNADRHAERSKQTSQPPYQISLHDELPRVTKLLEDSRYDALKAFNRILPALRKTVKQNAASELSSSIYNFEYKKALSILQKTFALNTAPSNSQIKNEHKTGSAEKPEHYNYFRILVVDDDPTCIRIVSETLSSSCCIHVATSGEDALAIADRFEDFDLILLDVVMPSISGYEVLSTLKSQPHTQSIPVIIFTGKNTDNEESRGFALGAADFLSKPFNLPVVKARTNAQLELKQKRDNLENLVRERTAALERSNRVKDDFLATLSHEFRTPLNAIIGLTDLIMDSEIYEIKQSHVPDIYQRANHLCRLIDDALTITELGSGDYTVSYHEFNLNQVIEEATGPHRKLAEQKGIEFVFNNECQSIEKAAIDKKCLKKIIFHLLDNSVKFTDEGVIELSTRIERKDADNASLKIKISDTGTGIPESHQEQIFESFRQSDQSFSRRQEGLGIGLAIVYNLTQSLNGKIEFESAPEKGSTFRLWLPIRSVKYRAPGKNPQTDEGNKTSSTGSWAGRRILIVEDNPVNQKVMSGMLRKLGCQFAVAENGKVAVNMVKEYAPDLVLMDCQMPVMDGFEATRRIRELGPEYANIPIIAVTANAMSGDRNRCIAAGMNEHVAKPIRLNTLKTSLEQWLHQQPDNPQESK